LSSLPVISGNQLIKLLSQDGWIIKRKAKHGLSMYKEFRNKKQVTIIPNKNDDLPKGTLSDILGPKQTNIGRKGLEKLINKYGL